MLKQVEADTADRLHRTDLTTEDPGPDRELLDEIAHPKDRLVRTEALGGTAGQLLLDAHDDAPTWTGSSSARAQRLMWSAPTVTKFGTSPAQIACACWHRGRNAQPLGGFSRLGGLPGIGSSRSLKPSTSGIDSSNALVYGFSDS